MDPRSSIQLSMQLTGFRELAQELREMPKNLARNALRSAVNAAASEVRKEVRIQAPVLTGRLRRAVYQKQIRERSNLYTQVFYVGIRSGAKRTKQGKDYSQDAFYWRFLEFGTRYIAARPFLRPAFEAQKGAAIDAIARKLRERILRFKVAGR